MLPCSSYLTINVESHEHASGQPRLWFLWQRVIPRGLDVAEGAFESGGAIKPDAPGNFERLLNCCRCAVRHQRTTRHHRGRRLRTRLPCADEIDHAVERQLRAD